jgi:nucleoside-diphosphate-sugar epimerase
MICSVLGCGWLGLPLAKFLAENNVRVKGSTTREEKLAYLEEQGIEPYQIKLYPHQILGKIAEFAEADVLILNFPPGRYKYDISVSFPATVARLLKAMEQNPPRHLLFVSSISVYGDSRVPVTEESPTFPSRQSGIALVEVEEMLKNSNIPMTILRMGGLVGYNRRPGRFLAGRKNLPQANAPVNLVHLDDCIHVIWQIIQQNRWNEVYNVCADNHPVKKEFYTFAASKMGLPLPEFSGDQTEGGKCVSNEKLKNSLNFSFHYADPYQMVN